MKKIFSFSLIILIFLSLIIFFIACSDDEENPVSPTSANTDTGNPSTETVSVSGTITYNGVKTGRLFIFLSYAPPQSPPVGEPIAQLEITTPTYPQTYTFSNVSLTIGNTYMVHGIQDINNNWTPGTPQTLDEDVEFGNKSRQSGAG